MNKTEELKALRRVAQVAGCIVLETPERTSYALTHYVRRALIKRLEQTLEAAGMNMKLARKKMKQIEAEQKRDAIEEAATPTGSPPGPFGGFEPGD